MQEFRCNIAPIAFFPARLVSEADGNTEVSQFEDARGIQKHIFWFYVHMEDTMGMDVLQPVSSVAAYQTH